MFPIFFLFCIKRYVVDRWCLRFLIDYMHCHIMTNRTHFQSENQKVKDEWHTTVDEHTSHFLASFWDILFVFVSTFFFLLNFFRLCFLLAMRCNVYSIVYNVYSILFRFRYIQSRERNNRLLRYVCVRKNERKVKKKFEDKKNCMYDAMWATVPNRRLLTTLCCSSTRWMCIYSSI